MALLLFVTRKLLYKSFVMFVFRVLITSRKKTRDSIKVTPLVIVLEQTEGVAKVASSGAPQLTGIRLNSQTKRYDPS